MNKELIEKKLARAEQKIGILEGMIEDKTRTLYQAREELRERNRFLSTIFESFSFPFYVIDVEDYTIRYANIAFGPRDKWEGRTCHLLTHRRDAPCTGGDDICPLEEMRRTGKPVKVEHTHYDSEGRARTYEVNGFPVLDEKGDLVQMIEYNQDITERREGEELLKRAMKELERTQDASLSIMEDLEIQKKELDSALKDLDMVNRELKDFAYIVSHDLKAPLRGISQLATWLNEDYTDRLDEEGRKQLKLLLDRTKLMHNMIESILEYSRVGRVETDVETLETGEVIRGVAELISPPEGIEIRIGENLPAVTMNGTRLSQIFQNLIGNAVKYMGRPQGLIEVGCRDAAEFWEFYVKDNGLGIEKKHFERIFQIFQKLKKEDDSESTGIGLTIVKKIVEQSGGRTWVESEEGKGSTFYFTLPKDSSTKDTKGHEERQKGKRF